MKKERLKKLKKDFAKTHELALLKKSFDGYRAIVISAGPSLKQWHEVYDRYYDDRTLIVCIKQTINEVNDLCDFHFLNNWNLQKYPQYDDCISVMTVDDHGLVFGEYDIMMYIDHEDDHGSLCETLNFERYTIEQSGIKRPVGPGIMHESVIYMLLYMGVRRIVTIGWDIADENGINTHADDSAPLVINLYDRVRITLKQTIKTGKIKDNLRTLLKIIALPLVWYRYHQGEKINSAKMRPGEAELVSKSIGPLKQWLASKDITLSIISDSNWMTH